MKLSLDNILENADLDQADYTDQILYIEKLIQQGIIKPVKSSDLNGKKPPLHTLYHSCEKKEDFGNLLKEIHYDIHPLISTKYYNSHLDKYVLEREYVLLLSKFLYKNINLLNTDISYNERSFQIWKEEKFLSNRGKIILEHCKISIDFLHVYDTVEPFAYFSIKKTIPQNLLILENKDPFYSMRKALQLGTKYILGEDIGTLIYGAGKRVNKSLTDFSISAEDYMKHSDNSFWYFGDLDYEGIKIYESLAESFDFAEIVPFRKGYHRMLAKAEQGDFHLPRTKEKQNRNIAGRFFSYFDAETVSTMQGILESDRYIPQEILNIADYQENG